MNGRPPPTERVRAAAGALGVEIDIRPMPASAHTAADAAAALGCSLAQVVKSLIFRGRDSGNPHLLLVAGTNRVNEEAVAAHIGEALTRADPAYVRNISGFNVGGVAPIGLATQMPAWLDRDVLAWDIVWTGAGTSDTMLAITPQNLQRATGATVIDVK